MSAAVTSWRSRIAAAVLTFALLSLSCASGYTATGSAEPAPEGSDAAPSVPRAGAGGMAIGPAMAGGSADSADWPDGASSGDSDVSADSAGSAGIGSAGDGARSADACEELDDCCNDLRDNDEEETCEDVARANDAAACQEAATVYCER